ncbi:MAG TPA: hypothetical protein VF297_27705 [Pyrinomonadaceae bacterium]
MTDINSPGTTDVDVETLMGLIRRRVHSLPDARYIMGEIEKGRLYADGILKPQPIRTGWKGWVKTRVSDFILRAVRLNFRFQEVFNHSVVGVLQLIAEDLHAHEKRLAVEGREEPRAVAPKFDHAAYEEKYLDPSPYLGGGLSIFREQLGEGDVVLVLPCGRGEMLSSFGANGLQAVGIDGDIFDYLNGSPDESFGGIYAGRVAERMTSEETMRLLELAGKKLKRGGVFVASAANIDHLPALRKFYMDPSLARPVPVRLLEFMLERSGLRVRHFRFSAPDGGEGSELIEPTLTREVYPYNYYTVAAVRD